MRALVFFQAAEREALEKAQERELRRQKEELMNGKVRIVFVGFCQQWFLDWLETKGNKRKQRENVKGKTFNARTEANADVNFQILGESNPAVERALENRPKK